MYTEFPMLLCDASYLPENTAGNMSMSLMGAYTTATNDTLRVECFPSVANSNVLVQLFFSATQVGAVHLQ